MNFVNYINIWKNISLHTIHALNILKVDLFCLYYTFRWENKAHHKHPLFDKSGVQSTHHYYKMWVYFISLHSLNQWIHYIPTRSIHYDQWIHSKCSEVMWHTRTPYVGLLDESKVHNTHCLMKLQCMQLAIMYLGCMHLGAWVLKLCIVDRWIGFRICLVNTCAKCGMWKSTSKIIS